ncbi:MAG TPA: SCO family protein [Candidatus Acidoferrales bacterium]|nr:SCO family protein [Candidatus Acidoferrales bacterium]
MPDVQVLDASDNSVSIRSIIGTMGTGPIVILPIYTRCAASCPLQTQKIKQVWKDLNRASAIRVLVFSFDPQETAASISDYRRREGVPDTWVVVHARESDARSFFDFFQYSVMSDNGQFVHPDRVFLLDSSSTWRFTMDGLNYNPQEVEQALAKLQSPGLGVWIQTNPDTVAWTGFLCILVSLCLLGIWRVGHKSSRQSFAPKNQA